MEIRKIGVFETTTPIDTQNVVTQLKFEANLSTTAQNWLTRFAELTVTNRYDAVAAFEATEKRVLVLVKDTADDDEIDNYRYFFIDLDFVNTYLTHAHTTVGVDGANTLENIGGANRAAKHQTIINDFTNNRTVQIEPTTSKIFIKLKEHKSPFCNIKTLMVAGDAGALAAARRLDTSGGAYEEFVNRGVYDFFRTHPNHVGGVGADHNDLCDSILGQFGAHGIHTVGPGSTFDLLDNRRIEVFLPVRNKITESQLSVHSAYNLTCYEPLFAYTSAAKELYCKEPLSCGDIEKHWPIAVQDYKYTFERDYSEFHKLNLADTGCTLKIDPETPEFTTIQDSNISIIQSDKHVSKVGEITEDIECYSSQIGDL